MAVQPARITVGTTATELTAPTTDAAYGSSILVGGPTVTVTLYLGDAAVTAATGWPLAAGATLPITLDAGERLYAAVATGTTVVPVLRQGV